MDPLDVEGGPPNNYTSCLGEMHITTYTRYTQTTKTLKEKETVVRNILIRTSRGTQDGWHDRCRQPARRSSNLDQVVRIPVHEDRSDLLVVP